MALPQWLRIGQLLLIRFYTDKIHFSSEVHALKLMVTKKSNMVPLKEKGKNKDPHDSSPFKDLVPGMPLPQL